MDALTLPRADSTTYLIHLFPDSAPPESTIPVA